MKIILAIYYLWISKIFAYYIQCRGFTNKTAIRMDAWCCYACRCFIDTGQFLWFFHCHWSNPGFWYNGNRLITNRNKPWTVHLILGMHCIWPDIEFVRNIYILIHFCIAFLTIDPPSLKGVYHSPALNVTKIYLQTVSLAKQIWCDYRKNFYLPLII